MRKSNPQVEMRVLASICNSRYPERKFKYLSAVTAEHFGTRSTREIYSRVRAYVQAGRDIPTIEVLADDNRLSGEARAILAQGSHSKYGSEVDYSAGVEVLTHHYKARTLLSLYENIRQQLQNEQAPVAFEELERNLEETLFKMRADVNEEKIVDGTAKTQDMLKLAKEALAYAAVGRRFKTGWGEFDDLTGGLEPGNVMLLTANTGGGKSVAAMNLFSNMYRGFGYNVTYISLEMTEKEMMERLLAQATKTEYAKIRNGALSLREQQQVLERYRTDFHETSHGRYSFFAPKGDYDIEQLFSMVQGKETDVLILDYLGLVKPSNTGKNSTEEYQLRQATRVAKRVAEKMKCAVILLAQLNDEGQIMYSKGIGHHVHYWLKWFCREEDFERGYVVVEMGKSRNSRKKDLYMTTEFDKMLMENISDPSVIGAPAPESRPQKKPGEQERPQGKGVGGNRPQAPKPPRAPIAKIPLYEEAM